MEQPHETTQADALPIEEGVTGPGQQELLEGQEAKQYKTLGVRVDNDLHARLSFITQLRGGTLNGEIVQAIRGHVETAQADPDLIAKAAEVREQIEREARARQAAIAGMFGSVATSAEVTVGGEAPRRGSARGRKDG